MAKHKGFKAAHFNAARTAIDSTTSHGTLPNTATTGSPIYGENHFGRIRDAINDAAAAVWDIGDPNQGDYGQQTNEEN